MTTLKIARMSIQNFCAVKSLEIAPNGSDLSGFGDNATGKNNNRECVCLAFHGQKRGGNCGI